MPKTYDPLYNQNGYYKETGIKAILEAKKRDKPHHNVDYELFYLNEINNQFTSYVNTSTDELANTVADRLKANRGKNYAMVGYANVGGNHWATYACNTRGEILIINTIGGYYEKFNKKAIEELKIAVGHSLGKNPEDIVVHELTSRQPGDRFNQQNGNICGAITTEMASRIDPNRSFLSQIEELSADLEALVDEQGYESLRSDHVRAYNQEQEKIRQISEEYERAHPSSPDDIVIGQPRPNPSPSDDIVILKSGVKKPPSDDIVIMPPKPKVSQIQPSDEISQAMRKFNIISAPLTTSSDIVTFNAKGNIFIDATKFKDKNQYGKLMQFISEVSIREGVNLPSITTNVNNETLGYNVNPKIIQFLSDPGYPTLKESYNKQFNQMIQNFDKSALKQKAVPSNHSWDLELFHLVMISALPSNIKIDHTSKSVSIELTGNSVIDKTLEEALKKLNIKYVLDISDNNTSLKVTPKDLAHIGPAKFTNIIGSQITQDLKRAYDESFAIIAARAIEERQSRRLSSSQGEHIAVQRSAANNEAKTASPGRKRLSTIVRAIQIPSGNKPKVSKD